MKKWVAFLTLTCLIILTSCSEDVKSKAENPPVHKTSEADTGNSVERLANKVKCIVIKDIQQQQEAQQSDPQLIYEFLQFLNAQTYGTPQNKWAEEYQVEIIGQDGNPILGISFGAMSITLDRNFVLGNTMLDKGTYQVNEWISNYLKSFYDGQILDPSSIKLPATLKINADISEETTGELSDKGSTRINLYDVIPKLDSFIKENILSASFEIVGSKSVYGDSSLESEKESIKSQNRCISVTFPTSDHRMIINSDKSSQSFANAGGLLIASQKDKPDEYKFITINMIFDVKVSEEFNRQFNALFDLNSSVQHQVTSDEVAALSADKKQYFMEYISKNLGINSVELRDTYKFENKLQSFGKSGTYRLLTFSDAFITRLLIFKDNGEKPDSYIGNVDIGSHGVEVGYKIKKTGDKIFIVSEKSLRGRGTGIGLYSQDWYYIDGDSVKTVLSIPSDCYWSDRNYGVNLLLKSLVQRKNSELSLLADYELTKNYTLDLPIADKDGRVTVTADKRVEFNWDEKLGCFVSKYKFEDYYADDLLSDFLEIRGKCTKILDKYYDELEKDIACLSSENARSFRAFLDDCSPGEMVDKLRKKLNEIYPE